MILYRYIAIARINTIRMLPDVEMVTALIIRLCLGGECRPDCRPGWQPHLGLITIDSARDTMVQYPCVWKPPTANTSPHDILLVSVLHL